MIRTPRTLLLGTAMLFGAAVAPLFAQETLGVETITWNVVGLKHNYKIGDTDTGPNKFPLGVRVTNNSTTTEAVDVLVNVVLASQATEYITIQAPSFGTIPSIPPGEFRDIYFAVDIALNPAARDTTRGYYVTATSTGFTPGQTPLNREFYVEGLQKQSRNSILSFIGPTEIFLFDYNDYILNASTAPGGYEQLTAWSLFPVGPFDYVTTDFTATEPIGYTSNKLYQDACLWDNNIGPTKPQGTYLSCTTTGKVGDMIVLTTTVRPIALGNYRIDNLIYDYSGSSFHYNGEYGTPVAVKDIRVFDPAFLGGFIWDDLNFNGTYEPTVDTLVNGVAVNIVFAATDGLFGTADDVTIGRFVSGTGIARAGVGEFDTDNLFPGNYQATIDLNTLPGGYVLTIGETTQKTVNDLQEGETNDQINFGILNQPLLVDLEEFAAVTPAAGQPIQISWKTSAEFDNAGFNVYRAVRSGDKIVPGERINSEMIPAQGSETAGAAYEFFDYSRVTRTVEADLPLGYFLEDVDIAGVSTFHGPIPVQVGQPFTKDGSTAVQDWANY